MEVTFLKSGGDPVHCPPLGWQLQETKTCEESKSSQLSASVLRSWCTHTRSSWWFLPTGEQTSAQERPVANRRARRAHTSRYAHTSPSMWVSDRATRSGGKILGRASGCFSPGLGRKASACDYEQVGEFLDTFLALLAFFWRPAFTVPSFGCHILGLWWAVSVWVDEGWGSEAIRRQTNSPGSVFTLLWSPAYTISLQIWWAFNLRLIISENSNLVTWKATSDCHLCFEELAKYPIWVRSKCGPRRVLL